MINVQSDINRNLEINNFMRRLTAYSFAFKFLLDKSVVKMIANRTDKVSLLKKGSYDTMHTHFGKFGHYGMKDLWLISIFRKY